MRSMVSIIVPVYNGQYNIGVTIEKLMEQTYKNIQIIIINDGSKDDTLRICREYEEKDIRIKVIDKENGGVSSGRNRGIDESEGDFICFVDAGDYVKKTFVENFIYLMNKDKGEMAICGFTEKKDDEIINETNGEIELLSVQKAMEELLKETSFKGYVWNKIFRRDIIEENKLRFDQSITIWEDVLFVFQYMKHIKRVVYSPEPEYYYIYMENSTSHKQNHILGIERSYSAIEAKNRMMKDIPEGFDNVKKQLKIRYVQSALAVLRNIGYLSNKKNKYYKKSIEIIRSYGKEVKNDLSEKDKKLIIISKIVPGLLLLMYKIKGR